MRSELFSRIDLEGESGAQFKRDLGKVISYPEALIDDLLLVIPKLYAAASARHTAAEFDALSAKHQVPANELRRAISILRFLFSGVLDTKQGNDSPDLWLEDLKEAGVLLDQEANRFLRLAEKAFGQSDRLRSDLLKNQYAVGVLPSLEGISATTEMRPIYAKTFEWGDDISEYRANIVDLIPIVSLHFLTDTDEHLFVQADETKIIRLIDALNSCIKDIEAAKSAVRLVPDGRSNNGSAKK